ncbi:MAG: TM0106 family RecB-like putative nuclease [Bacteroidota bacterium]
MEITNDILQASLYCDYKSFMKSKKIIGSISEYENLCKQLKQNTINNYTQILLQKGVNVIIDKNYSFTKKNNFAINMLFSNKNVNLLLDCVEFLDKKKCIPIFITPNNKVTILDKQFILLQAFVIYKEFGLLIESCKIIFGDNLRQTKIKTKLHKIATQKQFNNIENILATSKSPHYFNNKHCRICEYKKKCKDKLKEKDDLSLMEALKPAEIKKKNDRGIFSIKQLSYLFRPKKKWVTNRKFIPELKALAIREKNTFVIEKPILEPVDTEVYLDFEGITDRNFIYLIGVIIKQQNKTTEHSFWANNKDEEANIFENFINLLNPLNNYTAYHYGSYEIRALKRIAKEFPMHEENIKMVIKHCFNVLNIFSLNIYPPTYTNGLKDIANFLKYNWTEKNASGLQSIIWRFRWEITSHEEYKEKLLLYNIEDCKALITVVEWIINIPDAETVDFKEVNKVKTENIKKWGTTDYKINDFDQINRVSYFNYQRDKIYFRTNNTIKKIIKRKEKGQNKKIKIDKHINLFYDVCPFCGSNSLFKKSSSYGIVVDLEFIRNGIKRSNKELYGGIQICNDCNAKLMPVNFKDLRGYGNNLLSWAIDLYISHRVPLTKVAEILKEIFNIEIGHCIYEFKEKIAKKYKNTYQEIKHNLISGTLIHADETDVKVRSFSSPYIWVLTNYDTVLYYFTDNREADFLLNFLKGFSGVLVSDFYSGYDNLPCKHQKCLIHLIRDLNNDLLKNQFNKEFQEFVKMFGKLLRNVIKTIDRFGLSHIHLKKHKKEVECFFNKINKIEHDTELCVKYKKRLNKNKERLFTFLDYDNIPWNNNNAEHAIKAFAKYRRENNGLFTMKSINDYVVLLSIQQTCVYREISFLEFLKSEEISIDAFTKKQK